jgi:beta-aspartyl-peptidase (threonine type)
MNTIALALHGGAGTILRSTMTAEKEAAYMRALGDSLEAGWRLLESGASALDAVEGVVRALEDEPLFNAGRGSVYTHEGLHQMDASIMSGATRGTGAVTGLSNVRNPVTLARAVMEKTEYCLLSGAGAEEFARSVGIAFEPDEYFHTEHRRRQLDEAREAGRIQLDHTPGKSLGTVGAVALDAMGDIAAATSTGGMSNKQWGRIGDTPIIGAGTFADNATCAVSCTGHGEYFIRAVAAYDLSALMEYGGRSLTDAADHLVLEKLRKMGGEGGLIAVDRAGNIALPFNSDGMYRAWRRSGEEAEVRIYE